MTRFARIAILILASAAAGCGDVNAALEKLSEARQVSADLTVQFTKATDAANRAVMADTDEASVAFAHEADTARQAVHHGVDALTPMLQNLGYSDETQVLQEFATRFASYEELDRRVLGLAVENTNLKAQRLSFGPAQEAAATFRAELDVVAAATSANDAWHAKALVASAVATVREIQVLQAPHIAEADDAVMTRMEKEMAASETSARAALATLATLVEPASRTHLTAAASALDKFMGLNGQILALSRRNTNVRSLALSLDQKPALVTACEDRLHRLDDALAKRAYTVARWK